MPIIMAALMLEVRNVKVKIFDPSLLKIHTTGVSITEFP